MKHFFAAAALAVCLPSAGTAAIVMYEMTFSVDQVTTSIGTPAPELAGLSPGQSFTALATFDDAAAPLFLNPVGSAYPLVDVSLNLPSGYNVRDDGTPRTSDIIKSDTGFGLSFRTNFVFGNTGFNALAPPPSLSIGDRFSQSTLDIQFNYTGAEAANFDGLATPPTEAALLGATNANLELLLTDQRITSVNPNEITVDNGTLLTASLTGIAAVVPLPPAGFALLGGVALLAATRRHTSSVSRHT